jgi:hypothetical protein
LRAFSTSISGHVPSARKVGRTFALDAATLEEKPCRAMHADPDAQAGNDAIRVGAERIELAQRFDVLIR